MLKKWKGPYPLNHHMIEKVCNIGRKGRLELGFFKDVKVLDDNGVCKNEHYYCNKFFMTCVDFRDELTKRIEEGIFTSFRIIVYNDNEIKPSSAICYYQK